MDDPGDDCSPRVERAKFTYALLHSKFKPTQTGVYFGNSQKMMHCGTSQVVLWAQPRHLATLGGDQKFLKLGWRDLIRKYIVLILSIENFIHCSVHLTLPLLPKMAKNKGGYRIHQPRFLTHLRHTLSNACTRKVRQLPLSSRFSSPREYP